MKPRMEFATCALALMLLLACLPSRADEGAPEQPPARDTGWFNESELSLVSTRGNVDTDTLGLKNKLRRLWPEARAQLRIEGVRSDSGGIRTAVATDPANPDPGEFKVLESGRVTDLDTWLVEARYDRKISPRTFWMVGVSWDKNLSAGIDGRYRAFATIGNVWIDREELQFNANYGVSYTNRQEAIDDPAKDNYFYGLRLDWDYRNTITKSSVYTNDLAVNVSVDEPDDWTGDMTNAFTVGLSDRIAVRIGMQLLYNALPALEVLTFCIDDSLTSCPTMTITEKEPLDVIFTTSLVVSF